MVSRVSQVCIPMCAGEREEMIGLVAPGDRSPGRCRECLRRRGRGDVIGCRSASHLLLSARTVAERLTRCVVVWQSSFTASHTHLNTAFLFVFKAIGLMERDTTRPIIPPVSFTLFDHPVLRSDWLASWGLGSALPPPVASRPCASFL